MVPMWKHAPNRAGLCARTARREGAKRHVPCRRRTNRRLERMAVSCYPIVGSSNKFPLRDCRIHLDCAHRGTGGSTNNCLPIEAWLSLIHISEPTRLLSIPYAVSCLKKKKRE